MCVAAIAWRAHPRWQLVVIGNRDEYHARPAAPLSRWENGVLAGRDLEAGGTWLGVAPGRFALVTNRRAEGYPRPGMASRGALVTDHLLGRAAEDISAMNPFNLISVGPEGAELSTNFPVAERRKMAPGLHGLSNGGLDERWFKTARLETTLADWLERGDPAEALFTPLTDRTPEPGGEALSSVFIANPAYGTRCSSVIAVDAQGAGLMIERSFDALGEQTGEVRLEFSWAG